jgi:hypothetical protein
MPWRPRFGRGAYCPGSRRPGRARSPALPPASCTGRGCSCRLASHSSCERRAPWSAAAWRFARSACLLAAQARRMPPCRAAAMDCRRWLVWRAVPSSAGGKWRCVWQFSPRQLRRVRLDLEGLRSRSRSSNPTCGSPAGGATRWSVLAAAMRASELRGPGISGLRQCVCGGGVACCSELGRGLNTEGYQAQDCTLLTLVRRGCPCRWMLLSWTRSKRRGPVDARRAIDIVHLQHFHYYLFV